MLAPMRPNPIIPSLIEAPPPSAPSYPLHASRLPCYVLNMRSIVRFLLAAFSVAALSSHATSFEPVDFDTLTKRADRIFAGTVTAANPTLTVRGAIVTDFVFAQVEDVKGSAESATESVRMIGGTLGTRALAVPGAPTFTIGERYLVFVQGNGRVMFPTLGGPQGIYRIRVNADTKQSEVLDYAGHPVTSLPTRQAAGRPKQAGAITSFAAQREAFTQEAFIAEIRKRLEAR